MSIRTNRRARVARSINRVLASETRIIPMTTGGYVVGVPDPDRPAFDASGVVVQTAGMARREGEGARGASRMDIRGTSYRVSYAPDAFGSNDPPKKGDRIVLLEEPGEPTLEVAHSEPPETAHGRTIVHLGRGSK